MSQSKTQKAKVVTVRDIKELAPEAEVIQLSPHYRYIITVDKSRLVGGQEAFQRKVNAILQLCKAGFIPGVVVTNEEGSIKFYEFQETKVKIND